MGWIEEEKIATEIELTRTEISQQMRDMRQAQENRTSTTSGSSWGLSTGTIIKIIIGLFAFSIGFKLIIFIVSLFVGT